MSNAPAGLFAAWAVEVGIVTVADLANENRPPLPSELLASFVVYGGLGVLAVAAPRAAVAAGWGIVLATLLGQRVEALNAVARFMSGDIGEAHQARVAPEDVAGAFAPPSSPTGGGGGATGGTSGGGGGGGGGSWN